MAKRGFTARLYSSQLLAAGDVECSGFPGRLLTGCPGEGTGRGPMVTPVPSPQGTRVFRPDNDYSTHSGEGSQNSISDVTSNSSKQLAALADHVGGKFPHLQRLFECRLHLHGNGQEQLQGQMPTSKAPKPVIDSRNNAALLYSFISIECEEMSRSCTRSCTDRVIRMTS